MNTALGRNWWVLAARGLVLGTLIMLFGVVVLVAGILAIVAGVRRQASQQPAVPIIVEGIVCIAFGLLALLKPGATAVASLYVVSAFAIVSGVVHIVAGVEMRHEFP